MSYILFLDDIRDPPDRLAGAMIVRSFEQFSTALFRYGCPYCISFDHDLGPVDVNPSGLDCAKLLIELVLNGDLELPENFTYDVHSMNPVGAENIRMLMNNFLKHMERKDGILG